MSQFSASYQGVCMDTSEKQALLDLETLLKEPIPGVSLIDSFKFGFIAIKNHVARLGVPQRGLVMLPDSLCNLTSLQELALFSNRLTTLPDAFGNLTSLRFLNLVQNNLMTLPPSFSKLASLQILYLNENQLTLSSRKYLCMIPDKLQKIEPPSNAPFKFSILCKFIKLS